MEFKTAYNKTNDLFNVILLGPDSPLSDCCKMAVYFSFSKDEGGRVVCLEPMNCGYDAAENPYGQFAFGADVLNTLFYPGKLAQKSKNQGDLALEDAEDRNPSQRHFAALINHGEGGDLCHTNKETYPYNTIPNKCDKPLT